jgi:hypothetical protein
VGKYGAILVGCGGVFVIIGPSMPATLGAAETRKGATVAARTIQDLMVEARARDHPKPAPK